MLIGNGFYEVIWFFINIYWGGGFIVKVFDK